MPVPSTDRTATEHSARVAAHIAGEIEREHGWISFDRYMQLALYAPELGYYTAGAHKFGDSAAGGDFVTAPEISPLFARALARQIEQLFEQVPARIIEFGAGSGAMAGDLIAALTARGVALDSYSIVEISSDLSDRQRRRLQNDLVAWLSAPPQDFEGVMLANEVLDVMPVKLFVKRGHRTIERGVVNAPGGGFAFDERPAGQELGAAVAAIESEHGELPDGYASEINLIAESWMRSSAQWLARGALLVIDYGFPQREYYHPQRLMGTVMCHFRHRAHGDPLWMAGLNDITAHVDFSAMAASAHRAGLDVLGYTTQAHLLLNCGVLDDLRQRHTHADSAAVHRLVSEAEMGELVKALLVGRGLHGPFIGFEHGDRMHTL